MLVPFYECEEGGSTPGKKHGNNKARLELPMLLFPSPRNGCSRSIQEQVVLVDPDFQNCSGPCFKGLGSKGWILTEKLQEKEREVRLAIQMCCFPSPETPHLVLMD